ncbi:hypothetical protein FB451DRAFT_1286393, partial [Mycena latifolia]
KSAPVASLLALLATASLSLAKSCNGDECVAYFHGSNCQSSGYISDYVPTCDGNCFQYSSFDSILIDGNGILGTDCHAYSDSNCQNELADSGNVADDMKCYYNC